MGELKEESASGFGGMSSSNSSINLVVLYRPEESEGISYSAIVKNLTTNGIILSTPNLTTEINPESLKGKEGFLMVQDGSPKGPAKLRGKIRWARFRDENQPEVVMGIDLQDPLPLPLRQILEGQLPISAKDLKGLWDQWDKIHDVAPEPIPAPEVAKLQPVPPILTPIEPREAKQTGWGVYYIGLGVITAGVALQFADADHLNFSGLILVIYGSVVIAVKSLYHMWQSRSRPMNQ